MVLPILIVITNEPLQRHVALSVYDISLYESFSKLNYTE